jgi:two-component system, response regulator RegA
MPSIISMVPKSMRVLLVEDDLPLRDAIRQAALNWRVEVPEDGRRTEVVFSIVVAASPAEAFAVLDRSPIDLLIVDVKLGTESGITIVRRARGLDAIPTILAISGKATASEAFELAALGVRGYLGKPFDMHELRAAIQAVLATPPDLEPSAQAQVGYRHIHAVQDEVKLAMLKRALQLEDGNITRAARRLGITRTAVQQMLDRYGLPRPTTR